MEGVSKEWLKVLSTLSESQKRWVVANLALEIGYGGVDIVSNATGVSKTRSLIC